jgi:amino acid adenylation domain-containing protein
MKSGEGDRRPVLLMLPPGPEFIAAFLGCLYARAVAVPTAPPKPARTARSFNRLARIAADSGSRLVITSAGLVEAVQDPEGFIGLAGRITALVTDEIGDRLADEWQRPDIQKNDLGWLQYSSGSTGDPKGVMISHGNFVANVQSMLTSMHVTQRAPVVSWLPPFHDMGLIVGILAPIYVGCLCINIPPQAFLRRPVCWLRAVTHYRAWMTGGPNFAYDFCSEKISDEQLKDLDLSSLDVCYCSSEPIRLKTVTRFLKRFSRVGLEPGRFYPCYGMAENTLFAAGGWLEHDSDAIFLNREAYAAGRITFDDKAAGDALPLVSCGTAGFGNDVHVVDPDTCVIKGEGEIGEIWISGPSVAQGYWNQPEATEQNLRAHPAGTDDGPFLRTGDIGFFFRGRLYISGRCKEMIILDGRNFFPHDLVQSVLLNVEGLEQYGAVAFGVDVDGREKLVVVFEPHMPKDDYDGTIAEIRRTLSEEFDIVPHAVVLAKRRSVPKTSSGKIQQSLCRQMYLNGELPVLKEWTEKELSEFAGAWGPAPGQDKTAEYGSGAAHPSTVRIWEAWLRKGLATGLGVDAESIDAHTPFSSLGLNSALAVALSAEIQEASGRPVPATLLYDYGNIHSLAAFLAGGGGEKASTVAVNAKAEAPAAIIGMACRVPGASNPEALAGLLFGAVDAITQVPADRWDADSVYNPDQSAPGCTNTRWGGFIEGVGDFDPALFGISPREAEEIDPQHRLLLEVSREALERAGIAPDSLQGSRTGVFVGISSSDYERRRMETSSPLNSYVGTGNARSMAANRISYTYGLEGPSMAVDSACSSSLLALHLACRSLSGGESDLALACGVNVLLGPEGAIIFTDARLMAADGRCKTFSADADGYVRSEGCVVLVLKPLAKALRDRDNIIGLVRGSAVNQDGRSNGLTAPCRIAQRKLIAEALGRAGLKPSEIDYIEAHGSGTPLGDPIEFNAVGDVFAGSRPAGRPLVVSSVKVNIGHLEAAAGLAGVCRVLVSLAEGAISPHLHLARLNPEIRPEIIPAVIPTESYPWPREAGRPRRAGVSSFGFGGTNVHVILEEAPPLERRTTSSGGVGPVLALSARTPEQLKSLAGEYLARLERTTVQETADFCFTACAGRAAMPYRSAPAGTDFVGCLKAFVSGRKSPFAGHVREAEAHRPLIFYFDGYPAGGRRAEELYVTVPLYRRLWDKAARSAAVRGGICPTPGGAGSLLQTFCREYAAAGIWRVWTGDPAAVIFAGDGFFAAACAAGLTDVEDTLNLLSAREESVKGAADPAISPTVAEESVCRLFDVAAGSEVAATALRDYAFRSQRSGAWRADGQKSNGAGEALRAALQEAADRLCPGADVLAVGTGGLSGRVVPDNGARPAVIPAVTESGKSVGLQTAETLASLWVRGVDIKWEEVYRDSGAVRTVLPTYPFNRRRYWVGGDNKEKIDARSVSVCGAPVPASGVTYAMYRSDPAARDVHAYRDLLVREARAVLRLKDTDSLDNETSLITAGFDSLLFMELATRLRKVCGVYIPPALFLQGASIADLARLPTLSPEAEDGAKTYELSVTPDPAHRCDLFPLTDVQHAYWIGRGENMVLGGGVGCGCFLEGDIDGLDLQGLEVALTKLIQRHDMLRCVFTPDGRQKVLPVIGDYHVDVEDLSDLDDKKRNEILAHKREQLSHKVLPVDRAPLFELTASRLAPAKYRLHLNFDMLIADVFSFGIMIKDLIDFHNDPKLEKTPLTLTFRDYVLAVVEDRETGAWARDREYWLSRCGSLPAGPELPSATSPERIAVPRFTRRTERLDAATWAELKERAQRNSLTPSTLLLAAFSMVLARWCASPHFCLMLTTFDRRGCHEELYAVVGDFTQLLLLEVSKRPGASFLEHAAGVAQQLGRDLSHNRFSAVEVLRELAKAGGDASASSRSAVVFTSALPLAGEDLFKPLDSLRAEAVYSVSRTPQVWLDHQVCEYKGDLVYTWDVVEALFPKGLVDDLFRTYRDFLLLLARNDRAWSVPVPLDGLPAGQAYARERANDTDAAFTPAPLYQKFLDRAAEDGHRPAVIGPDYSFSYAEIEDGSRKLALHLRKMGLKPGEVVGVMMEKGWEQVVSLPAVLRAGGVYLPVDCALPAKRITYMLEDAGVRFCLVQPAFSETAAAGGAVPAAVTPDIYSLPDGELGGGPNPSDLAYVVYTSGTTGMPKGVMIEHGAALNTLIDIRERFALSVNDRVLSLADLHFDLSVFDVFGILGAGGAVVFSRAGNLKSPVAWCRSMRQHDVTVWNTTPSLMQMLLDYLDEHPEDKPETLRLAMLSGDWIPVDMPGRLHRLWPDLTVAALGGATEASIWSNIEIVGDVPDDWRSIPYGRPLRNQRYHVLDDDLVPCPDFVPGNLYIAGLGLARGYLNAPEQTRANFFTHPKTGERLYHTGDVGRYRPDGTLEFLGRRDSQVKINGFRIELGEVESAMRACPGVRNAAAVAVKSEAGDRLAGFVTLAAEAAAPETTGQAHAVEENAGHRPRSGETSEEYAERCEAVKAAGITLLDAVDRLQFKQAQHNIRKDLESMPRTAFSFPGGDDASEVAEYSRRISSRRYLASPVPAAGFSALLHCLRGFNSPAWPVPKYRYASAGWSYAVQTYVLVKAGRVEGMEAGCCYYHPLEDALYRLGDGPHAPDRLFMEQNAEIFRSGAFAVFLVADMAAVEPLYGNRAVDFTLIEAGLMSQLLEEAAMREKIGLCQIGAVDFDKLREPFRLRAEHRYLHCLIGGPVARLAGWSFTEAVQESLPEAFPAANAHTADEAGANDAALRRITAALRERLPEYMVPKPLTVLPSIPLTANGKVDRRALLKKARECRGGVEFIAPRDSGEEALARIIGGVLGREKVSVLDNFFDLGATSLQLVLFQRRINEILHREVAVTDIFAHPNISELNAFLTGAGGSGCDAVLSAAGKRAQLRQRLMRDIHRKPRVFRLAADR